MIRRGRAKSSNLFLLELIIAILFFSIASAVCVQLFVKSHLMSVETEELNQAVNLASGAVESITEENTGDSVVYYNDNWESCDQADAAYLMTTHLTREDFMITGTVCVKYAAVSTESAAGNSIADSADTSQKDAVSSEESESVIYELPVSLHIQRRADNE